MPMTSWEVEFDHAGRPNDAAAHDRVVTDIGPASVRDLFVFSHGWNNSPAVARQLYDRYFGEIASVAERHNIDLSRAGVLRIIWPSIVWPDEEVVDETQALGGPAAFMGEPIGPIEYKIPVDELLGRVFTSADTASAAATAIKLLEKGLEAPEERALFVTAIAQCFKGDSADDTDPPSADAALGVDTNELFDAFAMYEPSWVTDGLSEAAGLSDVLSRIARGARGALRTASYWTMKERAGVVGKEGLAPLLKRLHASNAEMRVHLGGHSFGARLVSYALSGLANEHRFVKSLFLVQGAFSHSAFATSLPFAPERQGALAGKDQLVQGPRVVTFSEFDTAVGRAYPLASLFARQDAANLSDRWGSMGGRGALNVSAEVLRLYAPDTPYHFESGRWYNLDGYDVIRDGGPPSGAHSDIFHPEVAWAALSAAQFTSRSSSDSHTRAIAPPAAPTRSDTPPVAQDGAP
jgi:hypothetical protein